jgi:uncharacterized membrane protein YgcG
VRGWLAYIYKSAAAAALLTLLGAGGVARADERILAFDSTITVNRDGTLQVSEAIRVRAEGQNIRRGIFRDFPTIYPRQDGGQVTVGFIFDSATRDGADEPWRTEPRGNGVRVYLGSASSTVPPGEHVYVINYRTDRQMGYFADHDELYWNVTGNGWSFAIDHASALVNLPDDIPRADIRMEAYTGSQGDNGQAYVARLSNGAPYFFTTEGLSPEQGLTIVASWPKGFITPSAQPQAMAAPTESPGYDYGRDSGTAVEGFSSPAEAFVRHQLPHDNRPALIALLGILLLSAYYYWAWNRVGRDPPGRVIIPEYEPPSTQSAASMRYLMRMGYDMECFAAAVLSLAVKGYLRIEQNSGILGMGKKFTLLREPNPSCKPLTQDEQSLLGELFEQGDTLVLEQENHEIVSGARTAHSAVLTKTFKQGYFSINGGWYFLGIVLSLVFLAVTFTQPGAAEFWPIWYFTKPLGWFTVALGIGALVINGVFGRLLRAPTVRGQAIMDHIRGFKMYMEVAEGEALKRITRPPPKMTPELYEAYLPAALALGVQQAWAERFAKALQISPQDYAPAWYAGSAWNAANIAGFSSQLSSSLSSAISSASEAPGSSSGSGGGGSSGGGGGGGGGGGW